MGKNMLIDLIRAPDPSSIDDLLDEPLGLMYLASSLKQNGHDVRITNLAGKGHNWRDSIQLDADIYGIQLYTPTSHIGIEISKFIKERTNGVYLIAGGAHPSSSQEIARELTKYFTYVIMGEGEEGIVDIANSIRNGYLRYMRIYLYPQVSDLDTLPFPARNLLDMKSFTRKVDGERSFGIVGSRGCVFNCSFCDKSVFGGKVRFRSIDNILKELEEIVTLYSVYNFEFFDDMFTVNKKRLIEFRDKLKNSATIKYRCQGRTDILDPEVYKLLKGSGCYNIGFGIESGNQNILNLMNKRNTVENNYKAIKVAQDAGLITIGYFIIGFPGETKETIQETLEFIDKSGIDQAQCYMFTPLPGTDVYKNPEKYGVKILHKDWSDYWLVTGEDGHGGKTIETEFLSADELQEQMKLVRQFLKERKTKGSVADYYNEKLKYKIIN